MNGSPRNARKARLAPTIGSVRRDSIVFVEPSCSCYPHGLVLLVVARCLRLDEERRDLRAGGLHKSFDLFDSALDVAGAQFIGEFDAKRDNDLIRCELYR
jgi:hypothetical protein